MSIRRKNLLLEIDSHLSSRQITFAEACIRYALIHAGYHYEQPQERYFKDRYDIKLPTRDMMEALDMVASSWLEEPSESQDLMDCREWVDMGEEKALKPLYDGDDCVHVGPFVSESRMYWRIATSDDAEP
jgi:hypothetical protein